MIIIGLSDIHEDTTSLDALSDELKSADVVVLAGDITTLGKRKETVDVITTLRKYTQRILAVVGNCDDAEVETYFVAEHINLHSILIVISQIAFVGVGGSLPCLARTLTEYSEEELHAFLEDAVHTYSSTMPMILVSHQPPKATTVDVAYNKQHIGSKAIREFILNMHPLICFTGHVHEGKGIETIGTTKVINPGPLFEGGYAYAKIDHHIIELLEIRHI